MRTQVSWGWGAAHRGSAHRTATAAEGHRPPPATPTGDTPPICLPHLPFFSPLWGFPLHTVSPTHPGREPTATDALRTAEEPLSTQQGGSQRTGMGPSPLRPRFSFPSLPAAVPAATPTPGMLQAIGGGTGGPQCSPPQLRAGRAQHSPPRDGTLRVSTSHGRKCRHTLPVLHSKFN